MCERGVRKFLRLGLPANGGERRNLRRVSPPTADERPREDITLTGPPPYITEIYVTVYYLPALPFTFNVRSIPSSKDVSGANPNSERILSIEKNL